MDFSALSDEQLSDHLNDVLNEQERRRRLSALPAQLAEMAERFVSDGGERSVLIEAVSGTSS